MNKDPLTYMMIHTSIEIEVGTKPDSLSLVLYLLFALSSFPTCPFSPACYLLVAPTSYQHM